MDPQKKERVDLAVGLHTKKRVQSPRKGTLSQDAPYKKATPRMEEGMLEEETKC